MQAIEAAKFSQGQNGGMDVNMIKQAQQTVDSWLQSGIMRDLLSCYNVDEAELEMLEGDGI